MHDDAHLRPWGNYKVVSHGPGYQLKIITVNPKSALSLQYHEHRSEHWVVMFGQGIAVTGSYKKETELLIGSNITIKKREIHRLINRSEDPLVIAEVQLGEYISEEDIVRLEDTYGRA